MLVHDNLNPCSYKGQIFYLEREALTTGRKIQTFELPGTNLREVQDLGAFPDKLALEMIVFDDGTGNLKDEVETFKTLLSDQTPGELTTWLYNTQQVKVEGTYQINMRSTDIGIARISVTFAALEEPAEDEFLNLQELDSDVSFALGFGSDALALLEIPGIVADNFAELAGTLDLYSLELVNLTRKFLFVDEIQSIASSINILSNTLITTPEAIASQFTELFDTIRRSQTDIENTIGFFEELTPFRTEKGDLLAPKSVANRELMEDLESIVAAMSLAVYYEYLLRSDITFKPDLEEKLKFAAEQYKTINKPEILENVKSTFIKQANIKFVDLDVRGEAFSGPTTMNNLVYSYYGDLDNLEAIKLLNTNRYTGNIDGFTYILRSE